MLMYSSLTYLIFTNMLKTVYVIVEVSISKICVWHSCCLHYWFRYENFFSVSSSYFCVSRATCDCDNFLINIIKVQKCSFWQKILFSNAWSFSLLLFWYLVPVLVCDSISYFFDHHWGCKRYLHETCLFFATFEMKFRPPIKFNKKTIFQ